MGTTRVHDTRNSFADITLVLNGRGGLSMDMERNDDGGYH